MAVRIGAPRKEAHGGGVLTKGNTFLVVGRGHSGEAEAQMIFSPGAVTKGNTFLVVGRGPPGRQ